MSKSFQNICVMKIEFTFQKCQLTKNRNVWRVTPKDSRDIYRQRLQRRLEEKDCNKEECMCNGANKEYKRYRRIKKRHVTYSRSKCCKRFDIKYVLTLTCIYFTLIRE